MKNIFPPSRSDFEKLVKRVEVLEAAACKAKRCKVAMPVVKPKKGK